MRTASLPGIKKYACARLKLDAYFDDPGDGRISPQIAARDLLWSMLAGTMLRIGSALGTARIIAMADATRTGVARCFCDDSLAYFTERLDVSVLRTTLYDLVRRAKRAKAFDTTAHIGLVIDGTDAGKRTDRGCAWCRPLRDALGNIHAYAHKFVALSVVGHDLHLLLDAEPYGPGDSEYAAAQRLLRRAMPLLGPRFADYLVVDGEFATAPFLHTADAVGIPVIARLKDNLPDLMHQVDRRFASCAPHRTFRVDKDVYEVWDAENFQPWDTLRWPSVRVACYRQQKPNGKVVEARWLTNMPRKTMGSHSLVHAAKSRWKIENQGFNVAKNQYHLEHIRHHETNSMLVQWLLIFLAMNIECLFRVRHLHRGTHPIMDSIELWVMLFCSLGSNRQLDTS
jgi:hypothetical protein